MIQSTSRSIDLLAVVASDRLVPAERLSEYAVDGVTPSAVVTPRSIDELSDLMRLASAQELRVIPWGGGTQISLGNPPSGADVVVRLTSIDRFVRYEPADLTVTVEAGMTMATLQARLAQQGQFLPLQVPLPERSTIGGCLATAASGPWRLAHGSPRDWLIGSSVVQADGTLTKSGGQEVKNVTGYDLNNLYTGSLGTLGIIVSATFKLAPLPTRSATLVASLSSVGDAMTAAQALLGLSYLPSALQIVTGDMGGRLPQLGQDTLGRVELVAFYAGGTRAVHAKVDDASVILRQQGAHSIQEKDPSQGDTFWQALTDLGWSGPNPADLVMKVLLQPSAMPEFIQKATGGAWSAPSIVADPGYGLVRLFWWGDAHTMEPARMADYTGELRGLAGSMGGHLVVERCPLVVKGQIDVWGEVEGAEVMRRMKDELDPGRVLNPGRFAAGI